MNTLAEPQMNATPLIDVLLVLLVMLIFTLPMATHAVRLNLPQAVPGPPSASVTVNIDFDGQLYWNGESLPRSEMDRKFRAVATSVNPPNVNVMPDKRVSYDHVAQVLAAAQRSGVKGLSVTSIF